MPHGGFFEFREKLVRAGRPQPVGDPSTALTVSELTAKIDSALRAGVPAHVQVRGEVSNFNHHRASGHLYFTMKDKSACIDCVMFRGDAARLKFTPQDGMELLAGGGVRVYAQRGRYQLYVTSLAPLGQGALELALKQLRDRLQREGLFAPERKKPLPNYPLRIALVTSRQTAALQDILKVLGRYPFLKVQVCHVAVQGDGAAQQIARMIEQLSRKASGAADLIVLARGGGSLEDLWAFNEEVVARAMFACTIPIVTGIGHEIDVSIADLVADYHAHTPTEAAQVVTGHWRTAHSDLNRHATRLARTLRQTVIEQRQRLVSITRHEVFRRPKDLIDLRRQRLDDLQRELAGELSRRAADTRRSLQLIESRLLRQHPGRLISVSRERVKGFSAALMHAVRAVLRSRNERVAAVRAHLRAISPVATLTRGYSITIRKKDGAIIRQASELKPGDVIQSRFADGEAESVVRDQKQMRLFE